MRNKSLIEEVRTIGGSMGILGMPPQVLFDVADELEEADTLLDLALIWIEYLAEQVAIGSVRPRFTAVPELRDKMKEHLGKES